MSLRSVGILHRYSNFCNQLFGAIGFRHCDRLRKISALINLKGFRQNRLFLVRCKGCILCQNSPKDINPARW